MVLKLLERLGWRANRTACAAGAMGTVLLVDDDPGTLWLADELLAQAGYRVLGTPSASEALHWLDAQRVRPDVLLVNPAVAGLGSCPAAPEWGGRYTVPGLGGYELVGAVRRLYGQELPVVIISEQDDDLSMMRCYMEGADYFLSRPFPPARLLAVVRHMTSGTHSKAQLDRVLVAL